MVRGNELARGDPTRLKLLLTIVYFPAVTPLGLISRLVGDPLSRRCGPRAAAYWSRFESFTVIPREGREL